jgi:hypothetical protein
MDTNNSQIHAEWSADEYEWLPRELRARRKPQLVCSPRVGGSLLKNNKTTRRRNRSKRECDSQEKKPVDCVVEGCRNTCTGTYYRKYRVCQEHAKAAAITINGRAVRFCQKCAKLEPLSAFDGDYRSCRVTLARHNLRRRMRNAEKGKPLKSPQRLSPNKMDLDVIKSDPGDIEALQTHVVHPGVQIFDSKRATESYDLNNLLTGELTGATEQIDTARKNGSDKATRDAMLNSVDLNLFASDPNMKDIYKGVEIEFQLSVKFQSGTPEDLPPNILDDISSTIPSMNSIEGSIRPGCTHVSMNVRMDKTDYVKFVKATSVRDLAGYLYSKWRGLKSLSKGFQVQINDVSAHLSSEGSHVMTCSSPLQISSISPCVVESDVPAVIDIVGQHIDGSKMVAFCRQNGRYLTTTVLADPYSEDSMDEYDSDSTASSLSSSSVSYQYSEKSEDIGARADAHSDEQHRCIKILGLTPGVCEIELMQDNMLTQSIPLLVLPSAKSVEEARVMLAKHTTGSKDLMRDIGMIIRHVCSDEPFPSHMIPSIERLAQATISYCMEQRSINLVSLLQRALPEDQGRCLCNQGRRENESAEIEDIPMNSNQKGKFETDVLAMNYRMINDLSKKVTKMNVHTKEQDLKWKSILAQIVIGIGLIFLAVVATGIDIGSSFRV